VIGNLNKYKVAIIERHYIKTGLIGKIGSVYFQDLDLDLAKFSKYV